MEAEKWATEVMGSGAEYVERSVRSLFPLTCRRLTRFRPYGRPEIDELLRMTKPGHQHTLHAFPGLRVGDGQVPPRFLRITVGPLGLEVFRETDSGVKHLRVMKPEDVCRFYYELVYFGYATAEMDLQLFERFPSVDNGRGGRR